MSDTIIPFTMKVLEYFDNGVYKVEYFPDDEDCQSLQQAIHIHLNDTEASTPEQILSRLAACSPQEYWRVQKMSKTFDATVRKSVVGTTHESAHNLIQLPAASDSTMKMPLADTIPVQTI